MKPWSLVAPSSRGLGLALTRHVLRSTTIPIVATARGDITKTKHDILNGLDGVAESRLKVLKVDMLDEDSIADAASECKSQFPKSENYLHLAFVLPGILYPEKAPSQISALETIKTFQTNTVGPMLFLKHFSPFLPRKATSLPSSSSNEMRGLATNHAIYAQMSARVGSVTDNRLGGWYSYRASKAALNQVTRTFDNYLQTQSGEKAMSVTLHPGTVKTKLSEDFWSNVRKDKLFEPEFAAERLFEVVRNLGIEARGKCWDWQGLEIPP